MPGLVISLSSSPIPSAPASPAHRTPPSHTRSSSINLYRRTNTLAIAQLPRTFFIPEILNIIQSHFDFFGEINQWVPLPGFGRIIIVYENEDDAEEAKAVCDPIILQRQEDDKDPQMVFRVYRADPNPLISRSTAFGDAEFSTIPQENYLRPPPTEKNFLISPPGSPPVGWEQIKEDPPNSTPLAEDLMAALRRLQLEEKRLSGSPSLEVLLHPDESGVGVYVEDCDMNIDGDIPSEESWIYGETAPARNRWMPPTAMPPINPYPITA